MIYLRNALVMVRHGILIWRTGQGRFRLETFGVFYPALPYTTSWWRTPVGNVVLLLCRIHSYGRWIVEMHALEQGGAGRWWDQRYPHWKDNIDAWNSETDE